MDEYKVQIGMKKSAYRTVLTTHLVSQAFRHYLSRNVHSGGKKRLLKNGKVVNRVLT